MTFKKAMDAMHLRGTRLMRMHAKLGFDYYVQPPGKTVSDDVARQMIARPEVVVATKDPLGKPNAWMVGQ